MCREEALPEQPRFCMQLLVYLRGLISMLQLGTRILQPYNDGLFHETHYLPNPLRQGLLWGPHLPLLRSFTHERKGAENSKGLSPLSAH